MALRRNPSLSGVNYCFQEQIISLRAKSSAYALTENTKYL